MKKILENCAKITKDVLGVDVNKASTSTGSPMLIDSKVCFINALDFYIDLEKNSNFISYIAEYLHTSRATVYHYMDKYKHEIRLGRHIKPWTSKIIGLLEKDFINSELVSVEALLRLKKTYLEQELAKVNKLINSL